MIISAVILLLTAPDPKPQAAIALAPITLTDAIFSGEVLGVGAAKVSNNDDARDVSFSIGGKTPVSCIVHNKLVPAGLLMTDVLKALIAKELQVRELRSEVTKQDSTALARVFVLYGKQGDERPGLLRIFASVRYDGSFLCYVDGGSQNDGFASSIERLAKTFKTKSTYAYGTPSEARLSLQRVKSQTHALGYIEAIKSALPTGDQVNSQYSFKVLPLANAGYVLVDALSFVRYDKSGQIVKEMAREWANGQQQAEIELVHEAGKDFDYAGRIRGKEVKGKLKAGKQQYLSWEAQRAEITKLLLTGKQKELSFIDWSPQGDPTRFATITYTLEGERKVKRTSGEHAAVLSFDEQGDVTSSAFTLGGAEVITTREAVTKI